MADIRDIVSRVKKSKLGQVVSNITSNLDRDKQQAGFQFTAPNSFARQGVQRVQQSFKEDPGQYSLQRLFSEQPKNTVSLFKPVLGQQRAEDLAYGLRGASQLTPFGYGLDQKTREISRLNAPQTERQGQAQSVGRSLYGYALTAPIGGTNYLANTVGRAAVSTGVGAGIGAGISKLTGGDVKEGARQGAFQGFKQGPLLAVTNPLTSKAVGAVAPGLGIVGSQVAKRSIGGVANVIEDEILSKVDGLPIEGRDRIQSLVLGAVMTGNDEAFKQLGVNLRQAGVPLDRIQATIDNAKAKGSDIKRKLSIPVKTLEQDPKTGEFITKPMWQVMLQNQQGGVGAKNDLLEGRVKAGDIVDPKTGNVVQKPQLDTKLNKATPEKIKSSRQKIEAKQIQKQKGLTFQGEQPIQGGSKIRAVKGGTEVEGPSKASSKISISRDKKYSFNINKKKLGLNAEQSKRLDNVVETMRPVLEANKGKTLTKQEIIEGGRKAKVLEDVVGREEAKAFAESLQATRNFLRTESQQVGVTPKFLEKLEVVSSVASDAGRRLQAFNIGAEDITIKEKVLRDIIKIGADAKEVLEAGKNVDWNDAEQITKFYRKFKPATLSEKLDEFRYTNMLSSPNTQINNAFSNFLQTAILAPIEKTVRGGVSFAEAKLTGKEQEYFARQGVDYAKGYWKALPDAIRNFSKTFSGNAGLTKPDVDFLPTSTSRLQKLYTTPLRALEASDQFFRTLVKGGEIESLKTEGITGAKASKIAEQQADYRTFRQAFDPEGKLGQNKVLQIWDKWNVAIQQLRNVPGGKYLVPFLQTPTNILKQGFEYSPLGFSTVKGSSNPSEQLTKAIIGSGVFTSAYALANSGMTTWDTPTNANERAEFYAAGLQPYSVKVGDKWVSYSKLGPLAYPIAMASALKWAKDNGGDEDQLASIGTAMAGTLGFFADQSYVRGIGDIIDAFRGDEYKQARGLSNIPAQLIPYRSFMGWIARQVDPVYRKTSGGSVLDQVGKSLVSQVPFASKSLEAYQTPFGTDSQRQFPTVNAFSPFSITKERPQEKEYYDARSQLRSQNKQADKLIKQIESGKNVKLDTSKMITKQVVDLTKKKIEAGIDVTDSELETAYLGKTLSMPSSNRYDKSLKDTQLWSALSTIDNNEALSDAQKQVLNTRIAKELGVTTDDLKLYSVAKDNNDNKTLYLLDQRDAQSNDDFLRTLINGRKPVNGKILTSDGVIDNLVNDGIIPKALGDDLKKIDLDDKGKLKVKKTSSGRKTKRATFNYSALKSLKPFGGSARVSVPKINARSLTFGG